MEENRAFAFHGGGPFFVPRLLEACVYSGAEPVDEKSAVWRAGRPKSEYLLFHCLEGSCVAACRQREYQLHAGCVLLLDGKQAVELLALGEQRLAVLRFRCEKGRPPLSFGLVYQASSRLEEPFYAALSAAAEGEEPFWLHRASLLFALLAYEWMELSGKGKKKSASASAYEADIRRAVAYMQTHLEEKIQLSELAKELHLSERNFRKRFTEEMGVSPKAFLQTARLRRARELLRTGDQSINEISEAVGYYSQFQFSRDFKKEFGLTPSAYRGGKPAASVEKLKNQSKK